jgi:alkylated DNA repair dioxygenase AlkB
MLNSITAAGFHPELMNRPDYLLVLGYPPGAGFGFHFDSRHRWGEEIVGFSIGAPTVMYFAYNGRYNKPPDNRYNDVPPRPLTREELDYGVRFVKRTVFIKDFPPQEQLTLQVPLHSGSVYIMVSFFFSILICFS